MHHRRPLRCKATRAAHPCDTEAADREDQLLDTMLGRVECTLATGAPMQAFTPAQLEQMRASVPVSLAFSATKVSKQEEYVAAVKTLSGDRRRQGAQLEVREVLA